MPFLYELFPVLLFFLAFKFYSIYVATVVGMVCSALQVIVTKLWQKKWDYQQLITLLVFVCFGSLTLYFHNPIFVKWKPTIIFWIFALVLIFSQLMMKKPVIQQLMEKALAEKGEISSRIWHILNAAWAAFFTLIGAINLYVAYHFNDNSWVNFKFYGITGALLLFSLAQAFYLMSQLPSRE